MLCKRDPVEADWGRMMSDVVVELKLADPRAEEALAGAIEAFAVWREQSASDVGVEWDVPDIMVKTRLAADAILKTIIFPDSHGADKFLSIWESVAPASA